MLISKQNFKNIPSTGTELSLKKSNTVHIAKVLNIKEM